ncbi:hypothetical protein SteCoe_10643 [Stentor coeruleus]|uniref:Uncharacterized protein n=1 Tax=Stentor coeruleus TaxID=5963 RepID=A0A1R2CF93_9CILI|nr:hypothetical protein SteCoe_10643 [Stentor coeruleus]
MELAEDLKTTLDKTFNLALSLEQVSSMIIPRKINSRGRKRLININKEIRNLSDLMKIKTKSISDHKRKGFSLGKSFDSQTKKDSIPDYPSYLIKRRLSSSIKEVNQRVKMSRAGKRSIGKYMSFSDTSPLSKDMTALSTIVQGDSSRVRHTEFTEEKPQPYISLTNGHIEDPIILPSFSEFLEAKGDEFIVSRGKDELFYRIEKAAEQIEKLKEILNNKHQRQIRDDKHLSHRRTSILPNGNKPHIKENQMIKIGKKNDLRRLMNQYYAMPCVYDTPKSHREMTNSTPNETCYTLSSEAEESLKETLKTFYKSKAVENKKLNDILEKLVIDRPFSIKQKLELIQKDREKYKNKHHSIEKFNNYREKIERNKREIQFKSYEQGLVYLEILDEYKRRRYQPKESELIVLELWKRMVEAGCLISKVDYDVIVSILTPEEKKNKEVQILLDKFSAII